MTVRLRPPMEFENLLPYDVRYTIYDRETRRKWTSYLRRGGLMPIHCVHLDQFVLFNVEVQETGACYLVEVAMISSLAFSIQAQRVRNNQYW